MIKKYVLLAALLFAVNMVAQCPPGGLGFSTQEEIDNFPIEYPDCTVLDFGLTIEGDDIVDLTPLSQLTIVDNSQSLIIRNCPLLTNLNGLENITYVDSTILIWDNDALVNIDALGNISFARSINIYNNDVLDNLDGLNGLTSPIQIIEISTNPNLISIEGLSNITNILVSITIYNNPLLANLMGLDGLIDIPNAKIFIDDCDALTDLSGLHNLTAIEKLDIADCDLLTDTSVLSSLTYVQSGVRFSSNSALTNITGLENMNGDEFFGVNFSVNPNLVSISPFSSVTEYGRIELSLNNSLVVLPDFGTAPVSQFFISANGAITSLDGAENLNVTDHIIIANNDNLTDITALETHDFTFLDAFEIFNNDLLSDCDVLSTCNYLNTGGTIFIENNAFGCNSQEEVLDACDAKFNTIRGEILADIDGSGCGDTSYKVNGVMVLVSNGGETFSTLTDELGEYKVFTGEGVSTTSIVTESLPNYYAATRSSTETTFVGVGQTEVVDFCLTATETVNDVGTRIFVVFSPRPGFDSDYRLRYANRGTTEMNGQITFDFDPSLQSFVSASPAPFSVIDGQAKWNFFTLLPFEERNIEIVLNTFAPPTVEIGDIVTLTSNIIPSVTDDLPANNDYLLNLPVVGSYDPNDKLVSQGEYIPVGQVGEYLDYRVRFQNTGTASAINVEVTDLLSDNLDWGTFRMLGSSHAYIVQIKNGNEVSFVFDDINLPAQIDDDEGSNGYVAFQVKSLNSLVPGDEILNEASIFFDFNPPIVTNTVSTTVVICPTGDLTFASQAEIDAFAVAYPDCSFVEGSVTISGSDITDLTGLTGISSIGGQLLIENNNSLTTLSGWDEVALLGTGAKITIQHNDLLAELTTFFGVLNEGLILNDLQSLNDLSGFNGISSAGILSITNCEALTNLLGLENVAVANQLIIDSNLLLSDISQLNLVIGPLQTLQIGINPELVSFNGLEGLDMLSSGAAFLYSNNNISNLDAFTGWTTAPAILEISNNSNLSSITGLAGISGPVTNLSLVLNTVLTNYSGLQGITKAATLTIDNNLGLLSLEGLNGLINSATESCEIIINGNSQLTDISALNGINPEAVTFLEIDTNASLASCNETLICGVLDLATADISIVANASGCESNEAVEEACGLSVSEASLGPEILIYPNPTFQQVNIILPEAIILEKVTVFDVTGKELMSSRSTVIELKTLAAGMYFVRIKTAIGFVTKTLIKR